MIVTIEDLGRDYLAKIKKNYGIFRAGGVYWCGTKNIGFDSKFREERGILLDNGSSPMADTYPATVIPPFTNQKKLLIARGGIGDLLALSVLGDVAEEVTVITSKSLFPVLDWWLRPPRKKHFNEPLFKVSYPNKFLDLCNEFGQQSGDHAIAQGSRENWFKIIWRSVGRDFSHGRPQLKDSMRPEYPCRLEKGVLVINEATSVNRTASLSCLLEAAAEVFPPGTPIYSYDQGRKLNGKGEKTSTQQFLSDLYYADFVISVDTSAIHFREGIKKPALGIYSSFTAESRTKYYEYTHSVNIESPCKSQPCFINFKPCHAAQPGDKYAPCLGPDNETLINQIKEHLWSYLQNGDFAWPAMSRPSATV